MKKILSLLCLFIFVLVCMNTIQAQPKADLQTSMVTGRSSQSSNFTGGKELYAFEKEDKQSNNKKKLPIEIYIRNPENTSLGNPCVQDIMQKYQVNYVLIPKTLGISNSKFRRHNRKANWQLMWLNGFRWKKNMQKDIEHCRRELGDMVEE